MEFIQTLDPDIPALSLFFVVFLFLSSADNIIYVVRGENSVTNSTSKQIQAMLCFKLKTKE